MPRGDCVGLMKGLLESFGVGPLLSPDCGFRVPFEYRLTSLDEFKAAYWK
jgi:hypothetical protein